MTGRALFNEVFLSDARVPDDAIIGGINNGWAVANTTLMFERAGLGAGGHTAAAAGQRRHDRRRPAQAGRRLRPPGRAVRRQRWWRRDGRRRWRSCSSQMATANGTINDPTVRQDLMRLHTLHEVGRMLPLRVKAEKAAGRDIPGAPNIAKLSMSEIMRQSRDLGLRIAGADGMLHAYNAKDACRSTRPPGNPTLAVRHRDGAVRAGAADLRRHRSGAAQHPRRACARPAQGTQQRPHVKTWAELPKNG